MRISPYRFALALVALATLGCEGTQGAARPVDGSVSLDLAAEATDAGPAIGAGGAAAVTGMAGGTAGDSGSSGGGGLGAAGTSAAGGGGAAGMAGTAGTAGAPVGAGLKAFWSAAPANYGVDVKWASKAFVAGDLNGDGKADLALANDIGVAVLLGDGVGGFSAEVDVAAGYPAVDIQGAVAIGDLNGDRVPDLAVATGGYVSVLVNRGDGTFLPAADYGYAEGTGSSGLAIGDLNGDGKADLVAGSRDFGSVSVLLNRGDGSFGAPLAYYTDGEVKCLTLSDLNGDGVLDLVVASNGTAMAASGALVYLGTGHGTFSEPVGYDAGTEVVSIAVGDLDADGKPDLALVDLRSEVFVLGNKGNGTFAAAVPYLVGYVAGPPPDYEDIHAEPVIAAGDLNGDGKPDLVLEAKDVTVLLNEGDGTFSTATFATYVAGDAQAVALADVTGDGRPDVITASGSGYVTVLANDRAGGLVASRAPDGTAFGDSIALADLDADGKLDAVRAEAFSASSVGALRVTLGKGDGSFSTSPVDYPTTYVMSAAAAGDLNGDGATDLVGVSYRSLGAGKSNVYVFLNKGDGTFGAPVPYATSAHSAITGMALVDLNGDARSDLAVLLNRGTVAVFLSVGDGTLAPSVEYSTGARPAGCFAAGDIDGDGKADLFTACVTSDSGYPLVSMLLNKGDGTFAAAAEMSSELVADAVALRDLNGDGKAEVILTGSVPVGVDSQVDAIRVLINRGGGSFAPPVDYTLRPSGTPSFGDVDGDGHVDMVVSSANGNLSVLLNKGDGSFSLAPRAYVDGGFAFAMGDVNGDGKLDLVYTNGQVLLSNTH